MYFILSYTRPTRPHNVLFLISLKYCGCFNKFYIYFLHSNRGAPFSLALLSGWGVVVGGGSGGWVGAHTAGRFLGGGEGSAPWFLGVAGQGEALWGGWGGMRPGGERWDAALCRAGRGGRCVLRGLRGAGCVRGCWGGGVGSQPPLETSGPAGGAVLRRGVMTSRPAIGGRRSSLCSPPAPGARRPRWPRRG